jgi:alkyl hydroperoxide reductase subunit D
LLSGIIWVAFFTKYAEEQGATAAEIDEAVDCTSLRPSNNIFYRFRYFTQKEKYIALTKNVI